MAYETLSQRWIVSAANSNAPSPDDVSEATRLAEVIEELRARLAELKPPTAPCTYRDFVNTLIVERQTRTRHFTGDWFAEPGWAMILEAFKCAEDGRRLPVTSLCIASANPGTTALRTLQKMHRHGLIVRKSDPADDRRVNVELSAKGRAMTIAYLEDIAHARGITLTSSRACRLR